MGRLRRDVGYTILKIIHNIEDKVPILTGFGASSFI
jgi:hypothetical protein